MNASTTTTPDVVINLAAVTALTDEICAHPSPERLSEILLLIDQYVTAAVTELLPADNVIPIGGVTRSTISASNPSVAAAQLLEAMGASGAFAYVNALMFEVTGAII